MLSQKLRSAIFHAVELRGEYPAFLAAIGHKQVRGKRNQERYKIGEWRARQKLQKKKAHERRKHLLRCR